jgi:hypothetical protein
MKAKILSLMIASILSLVILTSFATATISLSNIPTLSQSGDSFTFTLSTNETESITLTATNIVDGSKSVVFTPMTVNMDNNSTSVTMTYDASNFNFDFGSVESTSLVAIGTVSPDNATTTLRFEDSSYCKVGNTNDNIGISIEDINVDFGFGDDDNYWYPQDEVEIEVEVTNDGSDDIDNIEIEWALYTQDGKKVLDGDESDFDLKDDDEETVKISFLVDASDLDEDEENYVLYVRATGEDTEDDRDEEVCDSDSKNIDINIDDDFVVASEISIPEKVSCGELFRISGEVWNVGEDDQDEVTITIYNKALGIDESISLGDIDAFESEDFDVEVKVNGPATAKTYQVEFSVYDEDGDLFENSEDDESVVTRSLTIDAVCGEPSGTDDEVLVSAALDSKAIAGKQLIVNVEVANLGEGLETYTLSVVGYGDWADSADLSKTAMAISSGASDTSAITFALKQDIEGDKTFDIKVLSPSGEVLLTQPVSFTIEEESSFFSRVFGDNWYLWLIGLANAVLVIIIILVAIKIARS